MALYLKVTVLLLRAEGTSVTVSVALILFPSIVIRCAYSDDVVIKLS